MERLDDKMESSNIQKRPPYDPLLMDSIKTLAADLPEVLDLGKLRTISNNFGPEGMTADFPDMEHKEFSIPGLESSDPAIPMSVFSRPSEKTDRPALYFIHGGGQVSGNRFAATNMIMKYFGTVDFVCISVEYRVAPEHRAPAALHDSYAGLVWAVEHSSELGFDPSRVIVTGGSGGAPIAVGTTMLCVKNGKPYPRAQMILTPMLDDRDQTVSSQQFARDGPWCGTTNRMAWEHVLGSDQRGGPDVSEFIAPARATSLAGLPPTFVDAGECEVFRDEAVAFASTLWKSGVNTELHVWPGAYHGFDILGAAAPVSVASQAAKANWIKRILDSDSVKQ